MRKCLVSITETAEQDLADIIDYIANDNPSAALELADHLESSILRLEEFPFLGVTPKIRRLARQGYRMLVIDNYLVFYVLLTDEHIEIRRILSSQRDYKFLF